MAAMLPPAAEPAGRYDPGMIPMFRPCADEAETEAVAEVLRTRWWGLGPRTAEFEGRFADYVGARHCVGVNSGTAALLLGLVSLDVEGGEVITTSLTFISTNHAIIHAGARPVFADIDPETLCVDPSDVERLITPRTRAVVAVDYAGHPADLDALLEVAHGHGLPLLEDGAHACGSVYRGRHVGSIADVTCFSFHAVKNLAMGEGGGLTTDDSDRAARLRNLRWLGLTRDAWTRFQSGVASGRQAWDYDLAEIGFKANMGDIQAAIGLVQLSKLDRMNARRREVAAAYTRAFWELPWLRTPVARPDVVSSWHLYVVRVPERDRFMAHLREAGVESSVHYRPTHLYAAYGEFARPLPVVESVWPELVTLPMFGCITDEEVGQVIDAVASFEPGA
jgi:perosamine synthetase